MPHVNHQMRNWLAGCCIDNLDIQEQIDSLLMVGLA